MRLAVGRRVELTEVFLKARRSATANTWISLLVGTCENLKVFARILRGKGGTPDEGKAWIVAAFGGMETRFDEKLEPGNPSADGVPQMVEPA